LPQSTTMFSMRLVSSSLVASDRSASMPHPPVCTQKEKCCVLRNFGKAFCGELIFCKKVPRKKYLFLECLPTAIRKRERRRAKAEHTPKQHQLASQQTLLHVDLVRPAFNNKWLLGPAQPPQQLCHLLLSANQALV